MLLLTPSMQVWFLETCNALLVTFEIFNRMNSNCPHDALDSPRINLFKRTLYDAVPSIV